jgi:WS/DGAT/MGAT family acyltransferase
MQQLSALDSAFVYLESPRTPMHIGGVYLIDRAQAGPGFGFEAVRAHVESRLQAARTFRQRLIEVPFALGHPFWIEDPDFEVADHVPRHRIPSPGGKRELMALAAELFAAPLDRTRPLWELAYVEGVDSYPGMGPDSVALIARVHHAAVDGMSGAEIMGALLDPDPAAARKLPPDTWAPDRVPTGLELAARSYGRLGSKSVELARALGSTVLGVGKMLGGSLEGTPTLPLRAPRTPLNAPVSSRRSFGGVDFDLDRIKAVRRHVSGATVNDVLLAVCAGALRRWLEDRDALPERPLVAMVPMSVRGEHQSRSLGNQVTAGLVELATEEDDAHLRLAAIQRSSRRAKGYGRALPANRLMELVPSETAALASRLYTRMKLAEKHRPIFNLAITNVPGPQIPMYLSGARVHGHLGMAPVFDGMGLILVIFSFDGRLSIGISACAEVLPDVVELEEMLTESLAALEREPLVDPAALVEAVSKRHARPEIAALHDASQRLGAAIERLNRGLDEEE